MEIRQARVDRPGRSQWQQWQCAAYSGQHSIFTRTPWRPCPANVLAVPTNFHRGGSKKTHLSWCLVPSPFLCLLFKALLHWFRVMEVHFLILRLGQYPKVPLLKKAPTDTSCIPCFVKLHSNNAGVCQVIPGIQTWFT